jgi:hypothetical protein
MEDKGRRGNIRKAACSTVIKTREKAFWIGGVGKKKKEGGGEEAKEKGPITHHTRHGMD